jgi:succinyl-CoA synthetase alpha subunit
MPYLQYAEGCVGIVAKSGTLSYEAVGATTRAGIGQSLVVGMGGDMLAGTSLLDALKIFVKDPKTRGIIVLGEIGGTAELDAAAFLKEYIQKEGANAKPVYGMVTGVTAPQGKTMGHAGAVAGPGGSAAEKIRALNDAGVTVLPHPGDLGREMRKKLEKLGMDFN